MATYFIDPYKKYYDALNGKTDLPAQAEALAAKAGEAASSISSISSAVSSSNWQEKGASELNSTTLANLKGGIETIENNINSSLKEACTIAIGSMLPELESLKTEDENYENITKELDSLVIPTRYDEEGHETSAYIEYKSNKNRLSYQQSQSKSKCVQYQNNVNNYASQVKAKDGALEEIKQIVVTSSGSQTLTVLDYDANSKLVKVSYGGREFYVVNTKTSVIEYEQYVQKNGINQNSGLLGSECMLLSQYYAVDLLRGTFTSKSTMAALQGGPAGRISDYVKSPNQEPVLEYIYNEALAGRPTVLQVSQVNSYKGWRHLVTVVGFSSDVKSYKDLTPDNILVLDCVDGKIQTLGQSRSSGGHERRLFAQGGNYFARGASDNFLSKEVYTTQNA